MLVTKAKDAYADLPVKHVQRLVRKPSPKYKPIRCAFLTSWTTTVVRKDCTNVS